MERSDLSDGVARLMINVVVWLLCGVVVGLVASWRGASNGAVFLLLVAAGTLGALAGGVVTFIFDTTPLNALSLVSLASALAGAVVLVIVARRLSRTAA